MYFQFYGAGDLVAVDPSRIAASVVTDTEYDKDVAERRSRVTLDARVPVGERESLIDLFESQPGVEHVRIEPLA